MNNRYAAIDIGTNTILMLIAEIKVNEIIYLKDSISIARLGENVDKDGNISEEAISRAVNILKEYKDVCNELKVSNIIAVGTSALRDASNGDDVLKIFNNVLPAEYKVIPGEIEASLSFLGTIQSSKPSVVIDIGGGSTEIIYGVDNKIKSRISLNIGAVRFTEKFISQQPIIKSELENLKIEIRKELKKVNPEIDLNSDVIAVAGTPTTLAGIALGLKDYVPDKIHNYILTANELNKIINKFCEMSNNIISEFYNIHPKRADVITVGSIILSELLNYLNLNSVKVSIQGLRYGIIKNIISSQIVY